MQLKLAEQRCKSDQRRDVLKMLSIIAIFYWDVKREIKPSILLSTNDEKKKTHTHAPRGEFHIYMYELLSTLRIVNLISLCYRGMGTSDETQRAAWRRSRVWFCEKKKG